MSVSIISSPSKSTFDALCAVATRIMTHIRALGGHEPLDMAQFGQHALYNIVADAADWTIYAMSFTDPPQDILAVTTCMTGAAHLVECVVPEDLLHGIIDDLADIALSLQPVEDSPSSNEAA